MKKSLLFLPIFTAVVILIGIGTFLMGKNATKRETAAVQDCHFKGSAHTVEIKNDRFIPESVNAKICEELTIVNKDDKLRLVAFGVHNQHIYYGGMTEKVLKSDQELTVTLNQAGTYIVHDHLQEEVQGEFSVQIK